MPAIVWPSVFPAPTQNYGFKPVNGMLRSNMESGYTRQRPRFTVNVNTAQVEWQMEDEIFRYFESWYRGYLSLGSAWFEMPITFGGDLNTQTIRFTKPFESRYEAHASWIVTAEVECIDPNALDPSTLALLLDGQFMIEFPGFQDAIMNQYYFMIHTTFHANLT